MKEIFDIVKNNSLFDGITLQDFEKMVACLSPVRKKFKKGAVILNTGDRNDYIYIILSGSVKIVKIDIDGKQNILTELAAPDIFAEVFSCADIVHSPVTAISLEESQVLLLHYKKSITSCQSACAWIEVPCQTSLAKCKKKGLLNTIKMNLRYYRADFL